MPCVYFVTTGKEHYSKGIKCICYTGIDENVRSGNYWVVYSLHSTFKIYK